jgi:hypothetical protein
MSFNVLDISGFQFTKFTQINNSLTNGLSPDYSFYGGYNNDASNTTLFFVKYPNCNSEDVSFGNNSTYITKYDSNGSGTILDISLGYLTTTLLGKGPFFPQEITDMVVDSSYVYACGYVTDTSNNIDRGWIYSFDLSGNVNQTFTGAIEGISGLTDISGYFIMDTSDNTIGSRFRSFYLKDDSIIVAGEWINNPDSSANISVLLQSINYDATLNTNWGFPNGTPNSNPYEAVYTITDGISNPADLSGVPLSNLISYSSNNTDPTYFFANAKDTTNNFYITGFKVNSSNGDISAVDISNTSLPQQVVKQCVDNWIKNDGTIFIGGDHNSNNGARSWYASLLDGDLNFVGNQNGREYPVTSPDICGTIMNYMQLIPGSSSTEIKEDTLFISLFNNNSSADASINLFSLLDLSGTFQKNTMENIARSTNYLSLDYGGRMVASSIGDNLSGTKYDAAVHLYECPSGLNLIELGAYINSTNPSIATNLIAPILSPICFHKGTKIQCDQGIIKIENIIPNQHTINGKSINFVTNTIHTEDTLIKFKKDCFAPNRPSEDLICSPEHKLYFKNKLIEAKEFVDKFTNIIRIKNKKEVLYNILMDKHEIIIANNIPVESLHPNNLIAVLNSNYNNKKIKDLCLKKIGNINNYNKNVKKINEPKKVKFEVWKKNKIFD